MLVDADLAAAQAYGVVNQEFDRVPHPTVVIVDEEGVVRFFHLDENYRQRPAPEALVEALREMDEAAAEE